MGWVLHGVSLNESDLRILTSIVNTKKIDIKKSSNNEKKRIFYINKLFYYSN